MSFFRWIACWFCLGYHEVVLAWHLFWEERALFKASHHRHAGLAHEVHIDDLSLLLRPFSRGPER